MKRTFAPLLAGLTTTVALAMAPASTLAHTESDVVAVPAGEPATVTLKPTHGCGDAATIAVRTRVPIADAQAGAVDGWTHTATPDGSGNVVVEWTGGLLPADQEGQFPVTFTTPGTVGELLTFPFLQRCDDGQELAWIDGDPAAEYPAPRVLVLAAGSQPAATIDDVPVDAPGRDLLTAIADVDNPAAPTTVATTAPPTTAAPSTAAPTTSAAPATTASTPTSAAVATSEAAAPTTEPADGDTTTDPPDTTTPASDDDAGSSGVVVAIGIGLVVVALGALVLMLRRRAGAAAATPDEG